MVSFFNNMYTYCVLAGGDQIENRSHLLSHMANFHPPLNLECSSSLIDRPFPPPIRLPLPQTHIRLIIQSARLYLRKTFHRIVLEPHFARTAQLHFIGLVVTLCCDGSAGLDAPTEARLTLFPAVLWVAELAGARFPEGEGRVGVFVTVERGVDVVCSVIISELAWMGGQVMESGCFLRNARKRCRKERETGSNDEVRKGRENVHVGKHRRPRQPL